jgi:hypothetical protein
VSGRGEAQGSAAVATRNRRKRGGLCVIFLDSHLTLYPVLNPKGGNADERRPFRESRARNVRHEVMASRDAVSTSPQARSDAHPTDQVVSVNSLIVLEDR